MKRMKRTLVVLAVVLGLSIGVFAFPVGGKSLVCSHTTQGIHEITHDSRWPGTRAAHTVTRSATIGGRWTINDRVYTKSGWWDPTWDYYMGRQIVCP